MKRRRWIGGGWMDCVAMWRSFYDNHLFILPIYQCFLLLHFTLISRDGTLIITVITIRGSERWGNKISNRVQRKPIQSEGGTKTCP